MTKINTPFGEVEVPSEWQQEHKPELFNYLKGVFANRKFGQRVNLQLEVDEFMKDMGLYPAAPKPARKKLVEVVENGRRFYAMRET